MSKNKAISFLIQNCCFLQAVPRKFIFNQNGSTDITQFEHRCPKQLVILCALTFSTDDEFYWRQESKVFPGFSTASRQTASAGRAALGRIRSADILWTRGTEFSGTRGVEWHATGSRAAGDSSVDTVHTAAVQMRTSDATCAFGSHSFFRPGSEKITPLDLCCHGTLAKFLLLQIGDYCPKLTTDCQARHAHPLTGRRATGCLDQYFLGKFCPRFKTDLIVEVLEQLQFMWDNGRSAP